MSIHRANYECSDQTVSMRILVSALVKTVSDEFIYNLGKVVSIVVVVVVGRFLHCLEKFT